MKWLIGLWLLGGNLGEMKQEECSYILPLQKFHLILPVPEWSQVGVASFYSDNFVGKKTTSGEILQQNKMTAAHISLPIHTRIEVTNLANGKSAKLIVNDLMPRKHRGRILDLTKKAMRILAGPGYTKKGLITVRLRILNSN